MAGRRYCTGPKRQGMIYLLALIMLVAFLSLGAVLSSSTVLELRKSDNMADVFQARMSAESGLNYMLMKMAEVRMPSGTDTDTLIANLATALADVLGGTGDVAAEQITSTATTISVPEIVVSNVTFSTVFELESDGGTGQRGRMTVTGHCGATKRRVSVALTTTPRPVEAFDYGIASKGSIRISGNATVDGANTGQEATIFSTSSQPVAIEAGGHATIGGDLFVTSDNETSILLTGGGLTVAGETDIFAIIEDHAHFGVETPEFPQLDVAPITALATTTLSAGSDALDDEVLNNVRIAANTNPQFTGNTTINGVLVIESPNNVVFTGGAVINGIIICEDDGAVDIADKQLDFRGHVTAPGVGALPDTSEFAAVKEHTGTVVLAPGFGVTFRGNTNSINGTIAADEFAFRGNADVSGDLNGSILGLSDGGMTMQGNASISINRVTAVSAPAGFVHPVGLALVGGTYTE